MLHIDNLCVVRGRGDQSHTVCLPQLSLRPGQVMAVTGESGCGKSTLLEAIGLLLQPASLGRFTLETETLLDVGILLSQNQQAELADIRARHLGFVLQNGGLLPFLSVQDNITLPCQLLGKEADSAMLTRVIDTLKLGPLLSKLPAQLSFGERQRTAFARAILHRPGLVLADEPTAALDPHNAQHLFRLFIDLVAQEGMMALVVCHDWPLVQRFNLPCLVARTGSGRADLSEDQNQRGTHFVL
ncbi:MULTISPECIES: ABC transporter ATP-binding protein [Pantoea]|uniref:ATP-binding cassette domain-containing protein n=1 Tax=Pantoea anthophila TaxID=470931 RepID=A0ABY2Z2L4_9GAMM|nr:MULTISPECIES: ATP-binding cassette domain-containing protein [Pantoea]KAF6669300.1 ATP-binding cassette domain-containing protein [Pantoea sp. EKM101V]MEB5704285.1 ATP-binding cassette domain-containing protein [Pantoea anthophila]MEB6224961.1 ATP-binding cassette domain-containing protein [Pantoea anthophila]MEB6515158.1 ATP-binding cassette domain-containing protein [Pantoea anthophila]TPV21987.1 ATP-binding cassette domain-containing protein [Pantoea anthophila]